VRDVSLFRRRSPASAPAVSDRRQRSLTFAKLADLAEERSGRGFSVLDLGPAVKANLDFFLGRGARVTVADFYRSGSRCEGIASDPETRFDLVLAWDVLNYLDRDGLGRLMETLGPHFRPGTALHGLIATSREISAVPSRFRIEDRETIVCEVQGGRKVPAPRYVEQDLLKRMLGWTVEHRVQLRSGMLEYLFSYRPFLAGSVGADEWIEPSTFAMKSSRPFPIQRTTTTRSFSQSR
jgi:hypothetical protein